MILHENEVIFISHRRMFQHDEPRFFLGRTTGCEGALVKVEGFSFVCDMSNGRIIKKGEKRIKVLSLASPGYIVYQLPQDVNVEQACIKSGSGEVVLVDGSRELMNLSERTHGGHF